MTSALTRRQWLALTAAGIVAAATGIGAHVWWRSHDDKVPEPVARLFRLDLPDPAGQRQSLNQWKNRWLLVNFWATWCEPCREEIPLLVKLKQDAAGKNFEILGISIDDASKVRDFSSKFSINYPLVIGSLESIDLARAFGNKAGALPYTVLISPAGELVGSHLGGMTAQQLHQLLQPTGTGVITAKP